MEHEQILAWTSMDLYQKPRTSTPAAAALRRIGDMAVTTLTRSEFLR